MSHHKFTVMGLDFPQEFERPLHDFLTAVHELVSATKELQDRVQELEDELEMERKGWHKVIQPKENTK